MRKLAILIVCALAISSVFNGCKSSTEPSITPGPPATLPKDSSSFDYAYTGYAPSTMLTEHVTIKDLTSTSFRATRISDSIGGFYTTAIDSFIILPSGDLKQIEGCGCDPPQLPIATHQSYFPKPSGTMVTAKKNGYQAPGYFYLKSAYLGQEDVTAAGEVFACAKVQHTDSVFADFGTRAGILTSKRVQTYWYSAKLGYFAKMQEDSSVDGNALSPVYSRVLTGYKLGK